MTDKQIPMTYYNNYLWFYKTDIIFPPFILEHAALEIKEQGSLHCMLNLTFHCLFKKVYKQLKANNTLKADLHSKPVRRKKKI